MASTDPPTPTLQRYSRPQKHDERYRLIQGNTTELLASADPRVRVQNVFDRALRFHQIAGMEDWFRSEKVQLKVVLETLFDLYPQSAGDDRLVILPYWYKYVRRSSHYTMRLLYGVPNAIKVDIQTSALLVLPPSHSFRQHHQDPILTLIGFGVRNRRDLRTSGDTHTQSRMDGDHFDVLLSQVSRRDAEHGGCLHHKARPLLPVPGFSGLRSARTTRVAAADYNSIAKEQRSPSARAQLLDGPLRSLRPANDLLSC